MKDLISIIVPVYNVAPYLDRCLQSIVQQDYKHLEIILVDDGSTDGSEKICEHWAAQDERIRVIHQANHGQAQARNVGSDLAQGEWISFVDSDDYLATNAISVLWEAADSNEADMAIGNFYFEAEHSRKCIVAAPLKDTLRSGMDATEDLLYQRNIETSACGRLYRKSLTEGIYFPEGKIFEDLGTVYRYSLKAKRVVYCAEPIYYYVYRSQSTSTQSFHAKKMDAIDMAQSLYENITQWAPSLQKAAACRLLSMCFHILFQTLPASSYEKSIFALIKQYRASVITDGKARKITRFMSMMSYAGCGCLRLIYRLNQVLHCHAGRESH